jgi:hypothetical protein
LEDKPPAGALGLQKDKARFIPSSLQCRKTVPNSSCLMLISWRGWGSMRIRLKASACWPEIRMQKANFRLHDLGSTGHIDQVYSPESLSPPIKKIKVPWVLLKRQRNSAKIASHLEKGQVWGFTGFLSHLNGSTRTLRSISIPCVITLSILGFVSW